MCVYAQCGNSSSAQAQVCKLTLCFTQTSLAWSGGCLQREAGSAISSNQHSSLCLPIPHSRSVNATTWHVLVRVSIRGAADQDLNIRGLRGGTDPVQLLEQDGLLAASGAHLIAADEGERTARSEPSCDVATPECVCIWNIVCAYEETSTPLQERKKDHEKDGWRDALMSRYVAAHGIARDTECE